MVNANILLIFALIPMHISHFFWQERNVTFGGMSVGYNLLSSFPLTINNSAYCFLQKIASESLKILGFLGFKETKFTFEFRCVKGLVN